MKSYTKTLIVLLLLSLIWIYAVIDLTYYTLFQERATLFNLLDYSMQYKVVTVLGTILLVCYLTLLFSKRNGSIF
jgi:hypothetical protein